MPIATGMDVSVGHVCPEPARSALDPTPRVLSWPDQPREQRRLECTFGNDVALNEALTEVAARRAVVAATLEAARPSSAADLDDVLDRLYATRPALLAHARRVAVAVGRLAGELRLPALAALHIERAALVHDIGKLALPETLKAGGQPFTTKQLMLVRSHTAIGAALVAAVPYLSTAAPIVAAGHERFGGGGHPHGRAGEAIPLGARLIAVADAWDAFAGPPDERDAGARACANLELVRHAGSHFDPAVVRAWLRALSPLETREC